MIVRGGVTSNLNFKERNVDGEEMWNADLKSFDRQGFDDTVYDEMFYECEDNQTLTMINRKYDEGFEKGHEILTKVMEHKL